MSKDYRRLWNGVTGASDEGKAVRTLTKILLDKEGRTFILKLEHNDAELCINILDRVSCHSYPLPSCRLRWFLQGLVGHSLKAIEKQAFFITLKRLAGIHGRLPDSMMITEEIKVSDKIVASGGFADIRTGTYMGHLVALKTLRVKDEDDFLKIRKVSVHDIFVYLKCSSNHPFQQFCKEVILWNTLSHPNILKLIGVRGDMDKGEFITVSEWMAHGNIMEYIRNNHANRLELVRGFAAPATSFTKMSQKLYGAAQGLSYLHDYAGLTHGDIKGVRITLLHSYSPSLISSRQIFTCPTTTHHVLVSGTSVL